MFNVKKLNEDMWVACEGDRGDYVAEYHVPDEHEHDADEVCGCGDTGCSDCEAFWLSQLTPEQRDAHREATRLERLSHNADLHGEWKLAAQYDMQAQGYWEVVFG